MAQRDTPDDIPVEIHVGNLPLDTSAIEIQQLLSAHMIKVLQVSVKSPSRRPYAFVRVESKNDVCTAEQTELFLDDNELEINESHRSRNSAVSRQDDLCVVPNLRSFAVGVYLEGRDTFMQRWSSSNVQVQAGTPQLTLNFLQKHLHICFATDQHEYKIKYQLEDLMHLVHILPGRVRAGSTDSALVFTFHCAPKIFRQNRNDGIEKNRYLWVDGDIEEERDWHRTTGAFTGNKDILSSYFDYMVVIPIHVDKSKAQLLQFVREEIGDDYVFNSDRIVGAVQHLNPILSSERIQKLSRGLHFSLVFLVERMVGDGLLFYEMLDEEFFRLLNSCKKSLCYRALRHFECTDERMEQPTADLQRAFGLVAQNKDSARAMYDDRKLEDDSHICVHRAYLTPLTTYCFGPELDTPNRVLRNFRSLSSHFLRVTFTDENWKKLDIGSGEHQLVDIRTAIKEKLTNGIFIGDRHYELLAMSSSQLREGSCWFFASGREKECGALVTPESIRCWMGDFSGIKNVAKYAARMGQCFSCTVTTGNMAVREEEFKMIPEVKSACGQYTFSDGIGTISKEFAKEAAKSLEMEESPLPSAFQIRFAGFKGMVSVDESMEKGLKLCLRPSMKKFDSSHLQLEVIQAARFLPGYVNRQIILLLSSLGVTDQAFITLQEKMISRYNNMIESNGAALTVLADLTTGDQYAPTSMLHKILTSGFSVAREPFVQEMLLKLRNHQLFQLEEKARLLSKKAACLKGVLDESGFLDYGQVFVQIRRHDTSRVELITGRVAVAKNPCLHPGDVRVLDAVEVPSVLWLANVVNCIVFPQQGHRPHPNECSGSDLDGDNYYVTWEPSLLPPRVEPPMDYDSMPPKVVDSVTMPDIVEFFLDYMQNDVLGPICNSHLAIADQSDQGAMDPRCKELAKLQSIAVDYPKTGHAAKMERNHYPPTYPDFMKKMDKLTHRSTKVIGKLFQRIKDYKPQGIRSLRERVLDNFDRDLVISGHSDFVADAWRTKQDYDRKLRSIMNKYNIHSEAEVIGGYMVRPPPKQRRHTLHDVQAKVRMETAKLRRAFYEEKFLDLPEIHESESATEKGRLLCKKASAWYVVTYSKACILDATAASEQSRKRAKQKAPLVSFAWVPLEFLCRIKKGEF